MPPLLLVDSRLTTPLTKANTRAPCGAITSGPRRARAQRPAPVRGPPVGARGAAPAGAGGAPAVDVGVGALQDAGLPRPAAAGGRGRGRGGLGRGARLAVRARVH